ncbi:hypothetical protein ACKKBG_A25040 [Auxenochlorella protothecoides x Auxenochlorella symbiontica]
MASVRSECSDFPSPGLWKKVETWETADPQDSIPAQHGPSMGVFYTSDTLLAPTSPAASVRGLGAQDSGPGDLCLLEEGMQGHACDQDQKLQHDLGDLQDVLEAATRRAEGAEARAADAELALDSALDVVRELRAGNAELAGALEEARAASRDKAARAEALARELEEWRGAAARADAVARDATRRMTAALQRAQVMELTIAGLKRGAGARGEGCATAAGEEVPPRPPPSGPETRGGAAGAASRCGAPGLAPAVGFLLPSRAEPLSHPRNTSHPSHPRGSEGSDAPTPRSAAPSDAGSPFGSDFTLRELLQRTAALEARLLEAGTEKNGLQAELARLPVSSAGRTIRERRRREEIEARLDDLEREMSGLRLELKRSGCR